MKRLLLASTIAASWASLGVAGTLPASGVAPRASCAGLTGLTLPNAQILSATQKSGYCNVIGIINKRTSTQDTDHFTYGIGFALNLPNTWHGRFEMMGGGGTDGSLRSDPTGAAGVELAQGWAVAADDGGHEDRPNSLLGPYQDDDANAGGSAHFAIDAQARSDYGYNGIEKTATISKQIIAQYYGLEAGFSYIMGCSNGGRDAMVASQKFPFLFDGVISQNPGFNLPQAGLAEAWNEQVLGTLATSKDANGQPFIPDTFPPQDLQVASAAILSACDALDVPGACKLHLRDWTARQHATWWHLSDLGPGGRAEEDIRRTGQLGRRTALLKLVLGCRNLDASYRRWCGLGRVERCHGTGPGCEHGDQSHAGGGSIADDLPDASCCDAGRRTYRAGSLCVPLQF